MTKKAKIEFNENVTEHTIVGGRAIKRVGKKTKVPIGIERILLLAASNSDFKKRLIENRDAVIDEMKDALTESERLIIENIPDEQLRFMIQTIDIKSSSRKKFFKSVAVACAIAIASSATNLSCEGETEMPDVDVPEYHDVGGLHTDILTDIPKDETIMLDVPVSFETGGDRPDIPDDSSDVNEEE
ncbi:MAG: hypothetical protein ACP5QK_06010 [Myxococcota bacterium]